ncbi:POTASSIUM CHANNEL AKT1 [Salix purpurea]|uniref:Potassium channel n=1 Tax=Salix purpurea TaxID=77065 RepID=A0A9Q0USJ9_SALPP|nr:POTASSIUM CHANNEL AKT1 [Salix purpurea]
MQTLVISLTLCHYKILIHYSQCCMFCVAILLIYYRSHTFLLFLQVIRLHEEFFLPGEVIMEQGNVVDQFYFVCHGVLEEVGIGQDGSEETVKLCHLTAHLGEISILATSPSLILLEFVNYVGFYGLINNLSRTYLKFTLRWTQNFGQPF